MKKADMTPAQVAEWIWSRCHDDGDCLLWDGAVASGGGPAVTDPATGKTAPARRVLMRALGMDVEGRVASTTCQHPLCMAKGHLLALTRKQLQKRSGPLVAANVVRSAKLAELARSRSYVTIELVREIRASGLRAKQASQQFGIPLQTAARIISHENWREYSSPFAGLGAR